MRQRTKRELSDLITRMKDVKFEIDGREYEYGKANVLSSDLIDEHMVPLMANALGVKLSLSDDTYDAVKLGIGLFGLMMQSTFFLMDMGVEIDEGLERLFDVYRTHAKHDEDSDEMGEVTQQFGEWLANNLDVPETETVARGDEPRTIH